jgi:hypothetical protein
MGSQSRDAVGARDAVVTTVTPRSGGQRRAVVTSAAADEHRARRVVTLRAAAVIAAIVVAYHHSLLTLLRGLTLDTPLAYLGIVPFIALFLALLLAPPPKTEPNIHDRYSDYIVGLPLVVAALAVVIIAPIATSTFFWTWRIDLLTLPLFAAGSVAIVFGLRTFWRIRPAIALLLFAWPLPYTILGNGWLAGFAGATISTLRAIVEVIPLARAENGGDGSLYFIAYPSGGFVVSVASAASGNSFVGFVPVALAFLVLVRGPLALKATWLCVALAGRSTLCASSPRSGRAAHGVKPPVLTDSIHSPACSRSTSVCSRCSSSCRSSDCGSVYLRLPRRPGHLPPTRSHSTDADRASRSVVSRSP